MESGGLCLPPPSPGSRTAYEHFHPRCNNRAQAGKRPRRGDGDVDGGGGSGEDEDMKGSGNASGSEQPMAV